jgi:FtsZ-interacting cell division protein ZipA
MAELRWALLLAGLLFVAGLVAWEMRKRRGRDAQRGGLAGSVATHEHAVGQGRATREASADSTLREEPVFSMPDLPRREPVRDLPIVEIDPRTGAGPAVGDLPVFDMREQNRTGTTQAGAQSAELGAREAPQPDPVERASAWLADSVPTDLPQTAVLDWPPEDRRRIVGLRVVPRPGERFNGAALRQALVGEGFIHGELEIYHKPMGDGRVLISAASLTRPGTFDPATIDGLLFAGLNLFAVLPGPLPPREAVERLCLVARTLAQRLRGETQDARGQVLTEARVAELRREASDGTP